MGVGVWDPVMALRGQQIRKTGASGERRQTLSWTLRRRRPVPRSTRAGISTGLVPGAAVVGVHPGRPRPAVRDRGGEPGAVVHVLGDRDRHPGPAGRGRLGRKNHRPAVGGSAATVPRRPGVLAPKPEVHACLRRRLAGPGNCATTRSRNDDALNDPSISDHACASALTPTVTEVDILAPPAMPLVWLVPRSGTCNRYWGTGLPSRNDRDDASDRPVLGARCLHAADGGATVTDQGVRNPVPGCGDRGAPR